mgnify:CR=1 FL=1
MCNKEYEFAYVHETFLSLMVVIKFDIIWKLLPQLFQIQDQNSTTCSEVPPTTTKHLHELLL